MLPAEDSPERVTLFVESNLTPRFAHMILEGDREGYALHQDKATDEVEGWASSASRNYSNTWV